MNENELNVFNENVNAHKEVVIAEMNEEKRKINNLISSPNETEIMPLYNYMLCAPFDKNPFNLSILIDLSIDFKYTFSVFPIICNLLKGNCS